METLKIAKKQTGHLMTDLGIETERCVELCNAIHQTIVEFHDKGKDKVSLAEVVEKSLPHARNFNEQIFIGITAGEHFKEYEQHVVNRQGGGLTIEQLFREMTQQASVFQHN